MVSETKNKSRLSGCPGQLSLQTRMGRPQLESAWTQDPWTRHSVESHYPLSVIDDIIPELGKARVFFKADLKDGFLQEGMPGAYRIADDLLIAGQGDTKEETDKEHDVNLVRLFQGCGKRNIKLNKAKFDFKWYQEPFIRYVLSNEGVKPDPRKIEVIVNMKPPTDVQGVQRLIGMVKYLSKFLSNLSQLCQPLQKFKHRAIEWQWTQEQENAFQSLKWLLHKLRFSRISVQKPLLKDKMTHCKMASE